MHTHTHCSCTSNEITEEFNLYDVMLQEEMQKCAETEQDKLQLLTEWIEQHDEKDQQTKGLLSCCCGSYFCCCFIA